MTKANILKVINQSNINKNIKWSILENSATKIVLTNDYDKSINFSITVTRENEYEWIDARNNHMGCTVATLLKGDDRWSDYKDTEDGIIEAIKATVVYFNCRY